MSNYMKGRAREYRCQDTLRAQGYGTTRAASSQGRFDIIGVRAGEIRLIQVKSCSGNLSRKEREDLIALADTLRGKASVELWRYSYRVADPAIEIL